MIAEVVAEAPSIVPAHGGDVNDVSSSSIGQFLVKLSVMKYVNTYSIYNAWLLINLFLRCHQLSKS